MPSLALKIDASIAEAARAAAAVSERSLTAQIEHWARMGMELDKRLTGSAMMAFKRAAGDTTKVEDSADAAEIESVLTTLGVPSLATTKALASGNLDGRATYGADPAQPDAIIRHEADGSETRGRMDGKTFVPFPTRNCLPLLRMLIYRQFRLIQGPGPQLRKAHAPSA